MQSLRPSHRLHYPWEYRLFFQNSHVIRLPDCTVFRISNSTGHFRLGITLKARGRSIDRNRVKRQIREAFRKNGAHLGSYDYNVVIPGHRKLAHPMSLQVKHSLKTAFESKLRAPINLKSS